MNIENDLSDEEFKCDQNTNDDSDDSGPNSNEEEPTSFLPRPNYSRRQNLKASKQIKKSSS